MKKPPSLARSKDRSRHDLSFLHRPCHAGKAQGGDADRIGGVNWRISNPDFERAVRESFARQAAMATLGVEIVSVEAGAVRLALAASPGLTQQNGYVHAGVLAACADSACGYAAYTLAPAGSDVLAVEFKISLLRPARAPRFEARARVLRPGRTLTYCECGIFGLEESGETLVATMLSTIVTRAAGGDDRSSSPTR
jgi:uncharacterized protein (TIGR00369 family)